MRTHAQRAPASTVRAGAQTLLTAAGRRALEAGERWLAPAAPQAAADEDERLVAALLAPPPLEQAQGSLAYWRERRRRLPAYRVRARREADAAIERALADVRAARRARHGPTLVELLRELPAVAAGLAAVRRAVTLAAVAVLALLVVLAAASALLWSEAEPVLRSLLAG